LLQVQFQGLYLESHVCSSGTGRRFHLVLDQCSGIGHIPKLAFVRTTGLPVGAMLLTRYSNF